MPIPHTWPSLPQLVSGIFLTLTACVMHGHGCYLYLCDEGQSAGSNWQWECATNFKLLLLYKVYRSDVYNVYSSLVVDGFLQNYIQELSKKI